MTKVKDILSVTPEELAKLDFIVCIDSSGSTSGASSRLKGKTLFEEMEEEVGRIARECAKYDDDGITLVQFASRARSIDGVTAQRVSDVFKEMSPGGNTNLGDAIRQVELKAKASTKNVVAIIFTDGAASNENDVLDAVRSIARLKRPKIGITIVQVGDDPGATKFLEWLDDELEAKGIPDVVSTLTFEQAEDQSFGNLVWLAQNG